MKQFNAYCSFLEKFLNVGYQDVFFNQFTEPHKLILRHDIDFNCEYALGMAKAEAEIGVKSTYFFMISCDFYNLFSKTNSEYVEQILNLGHQVSLHFDPTVYADPKKGLVCELDQFSSRFGISQLHIISLHEPSEIFIRSNEQICGIDHTYMSKYIDKIVYMSDSRAYFKYGNPLQSRAFYEKRSIHLLTHPIWWKDGLAKRDDTLRFFLQTKNDAIAKKIPSYYFDNSDLSSTPSAISLNNLCKNFL